MGLGIIPSTTTDAGAAELLPEAHRNDRSRGVVVATLGGIVAIWLFSLATGALGLHWRVRIR